MSVQGLRAAHAISLFTKVIRVVILSIQAASLLLKLGVKSTTVPGVHVFGLVWLLRVPKGRQKN